MENINIYEVRLLTVPGFRADSVLVFAILIFRIAQHTKPSALESSPYVKYVPDMKTEKITDPQISSGISRNVQSTQLLK